MVVMRIDQLVASFLFGVVFWGLCAKMAVPPAQVVRTDSLSTVTSLELAEVKAWKDSLSTQLNEVTGTVRLLQLGRLHDKWLQAEQVRQTKEREVDTLEQELKTLPVRGSTRRREVGVSLLRARAAVLAQGIIRERLMEDMRAATFPNYHEEPDNSTTFVHRDLANDFDPSIPMLKRVEGVRMNANAYGVWAWKQGVNPHTANLVVIAADKPKQHTVELLLEGGYIVWKRHYHCPGECRELVSYLSYLADDTSPAKPMPKHIIFIHGHEESWHQPAPLLELIADGVECSNNTGAYVPLGHHGMPLGSAAYGTQDGRLVNTYVEHLGEFGVPRGKTLEGFCCAQFVVTPQLIKRNTMSFYKTFLEKKLELKVDGFLGEFAFGWIFGDPEVRAATGGPPAQCRKRREIAAPFVASSRSGMWTNPITKPRFTVVLGQRSANETENLEVVASLTRLLPDSANVWIRHESHWCSAGNWVGDHCCGPHRGYLSFMNTFKNDDVRTESDAYVFVKGGRIFTREDVNLIMDRVQCAQRTGRYTPLRNTPHVKNNRQMRFPLPKSSIIRSHQWRGQLKAFAGGEFVMPHAALVNAPTNAIQSVYETHVNGCGIWKLNPDVTDYYWHWIMGESSHMQHFKCTADDVWQTEAPPSLY